MSIARKLMSAGAKEPEGAWDLSYAYYDPPEGLAGRISTTGPRVAFFNSGNETLQGRGMFFKPDGTVFYLVGGSADAEVNQYTLSTPWLISTATYSIRGTIGSDAFDVFFKPDGTKMYVARSNLSVSEVVEFDLGTAWAVNTRTLVQTQSVSAQENRVRGVAFKPDGTKMYVTGQTGDDVNEYNLSTPWDISTASYLQAFVHGRSDAYALRFSEDGAAMYVLNYSASSGGGVFEYSLSTPWDVSSASVVSSFDGAAFTGMHLKPDGSALYLHDLTNTHNEQYPLGGFSVAAENGTATGIFFKPDGTKMYVTGTAAPDEVNEYDLSTPWNISTASFLQSFGVGAQENDPKDLFFKPDGTKMYIIGAGGDAVYEYDLSSAWDVSTAVFLQNFSVATEETTPNGIFFKPDGTKMYVIGQLGDDVNEYDLSTPWDISTASYFQNFSVAAQETSPQGLFFKPDGTKMYVIGSTGDDVNEYNLSTPWDVSTSVFLQLFSVAAQEVQPEGLFFKPDGTQMFIVGRLSPRVFTYTLGPQT